jgi:hypothetical protein
MPTKARAQSLHSKNFLLQTLQERADFIIVDPVLIPAAKDTTATFVHQFRHVGGRESFIPKPVDCVFARLLYRRKVPLTRSNSLLQFTKCFGVSMSAAIQSLNNKIHEAVWQASNARNQRPRGGIESTYHEQNGGGAGVRCGEVISFIRGGMLFVKCSDPTANVVKFLHNLCVSPFGPVKGNKKRYRSRQGAVEYQTQNLSMPKFEWDQEACVGLGGIESKLSNKASSWSENEVESFSTNCSSSMQYRVPEYSVPG